jgi:hypothetical protein
VQRPVDLDEFHGAAVLGEDRERRKAEVPAPQCVRVRCRRRDRRRASHTRAAIAVHDVFGFDARPHDHAKFGEIRADGCELLGEVALRSVQRVRLLEQRRHLGVVLVARVPTDRVAAIARGFVCGSDRHELLPPPAGVRDVRGKRVFVWAARAYGRGVTLSAESSLLTHRSPRGGYPSRKP